MFTITEEWKYIDYGQNKVKNRVESRWLKMKVKRNLKFVKIWWHKQSVSCYCTQAWDAQKHIEITKNSAAASTLPGMIAPSVFFSCFTSLSLFLNPPFTRMAACQMWREAYLNLMILQMPFFMLNNNSVLIDTDPPTHYLDTNRVVCHSTLSHQF